MSTIKVGIVTLSLDDQEHLHWVAELGRLLRAMQKKGQVFVEKSNTRRKNTYKVFETPPVLHPRAWAHLENLRALMYCRSWVVVSNEDLMNVIAQAESYGTDLDQIYQTTKNKISIQGPVKHTHQFQGLVRRRITHRFLHRQPKLFSKAA